MDQVIILSSIHKLTFAFLALILLVLFLKLLDHWVGQKFSVTHATIRSNALASAIYHGARWIGAAILLGMLMGCVPVNAHTFTTAYDAQIKRAADLWLPGIEWRLLKAQLYQESRLDPTARSGAGAEGIAQFMGPTWADVSKHLGYDGVPRTEAGPAIQGAAYYDAQERRPWASILDYDRHRFGLASYNAGGGNVHRAWSLCGAPNTWADTAPCVVQVTGMANAKQTTDYVTRIWEWWAMMETGS